MYLYVLKSIQDSHKVGGLETVKLHKRIAHSSPWNNTFCCKEIIVTSNDDESSLFVRCAKTSVNDRIYKSIGLPVNEPAQSPVFKQTIGNKCFRYRYTKPQSHHEAVGN